MASFSRPIRGVDWLDDIGIRLRGIKECSLGKRGADGPEATHDRPENGMYKGGVLYNIDERYGENKYHGVSRSL